jgi:tetrahydromethanopterin S-methyltransferase subunit B
MLTTEKRKKMESLIDSVMNAIDPSGTNAKKYRNMFQTMNDKQFD